MTKFLLLVSHAAVLAVGFALGIYALPILVAPSAPTTAEVGAQASQASFVGQFRRDLKDSDALHWGEGTVSVSARSIGLVGELAPGPVSGHSMPSATRLFQDAIAAFPGVAPGASHGEFKPKRGSGASYRDGWVKFRIRKSEVGWRTLEFLAWAFDDLTRSTSTISREATTRCVCFLRHRRLI